MRPTQHLVWLLAWILTCLLPVGRLAAQATAAPPAASPADADPLADLPEDLHTKVDGIMLKAAQAKRTIFELRMKDATAALVKTTGLTDAAALAALGAAAREAGERSIVECIALARKRIGTTYRRNTEQMVLSINATVGTGGLAAVRSEGETLPDEQMVWIGALQRVLTPAQLAAWQATVAGEHTKENLEIAKFLDVQVERVREQSTLAMRSRVAELTAGLDLSPDRVEALEALGRNAVEESLKGFRQTTQRSLRGMAAVQRQRMLGANNRAFFGQQQQGDDAPTNQAVWKTGLEKLFTAADRQRLQELQAARRTRRTRLLGQMLLAVLDEKTALTTSQRERLQAVAERLAQEQKTLYPGDDPQDYFQYSREVFFAAAAHLKEDEALPVLDAAQWQHWTLACREAAGGRNSSQGRRGNRMTADDKAPPLSEGMEPEEIERVLSDGLDAKTADERQRLLAAIFLKIEDAARVAGLDDKQTGRLQTAARGTAEAALAPWKVNVMQSVRSQIDNGDPENFRNLLANLPDFQSSSNDSASNQPPTFWDKTVERELTAAQRAAWKREVDARAAYRDAATVGLILAEFDRRYQLSPAQWDAMQPLLGGIMRDYGPDFNRMFAYNSGSAPWFFQSFTMFMPLAGIPDDKFKEVIGKERWERWNASQEHTNSGNYWQNVRQYHKQRKQEDDK